MERQFVEEQEDVFAKYNNNYYDYYLHYLFPLALEYGMTAKEFWEDDPQLLVSYHIFFTNKREVMEKDLDHIAWLFGLYNHQGNTVIGNALSYNISRMLGNKGSKASELKYPEHPHSVKQNEVSRVLREQNSLQKKYNENLVHFGSIKSRMLEELNKTK